MTDLQEAFLIELKSKEKFTVKEYAQLFNKYIKLAVEHEENNGANIHQAKSMGHYYTVTILSDFIGSENKLSRIIAIQEAL